MNPQLETLLEMQDLRSQQKALQQDGMREMESELFEMEVGEAVGKIDEKLEELESRLEPEVRARYRRILSGHERTVVPVVDGTCYGCFVSVPTAWASDAERNEALDVCDNCGRFLYHVD